MERPILFSGPMARAILEGRKTQTRRVVSQKHLPFLKDLLGGFFDGKWNQRPMPYGKPGDRLWVRETWSRMGCKENCGHLSCSTIYRSDSERSIGMYGAVKWKPSIFMPRWASRLTLEVVNVRVERLQEISHEDAVAEGCYRIEPCEEYPHGNAWGRLGFSQLWDSINAKRGHGWDTNPWVWVVEFKNL